MKSTEYSVLSEGKMWFFVKLAHSSKTLVKFRIGESLQPSLVANRALA